jgi:FixJ family two-component response regulator
MPDTATPPAHTDLPRVLLVDDDPRVLEALERSLRSRFAVVTVASGAAALDTLKRDASFAVIVSDLRMPSMNGVTLLSRTRELAPDAMRVLLTGHADLDVAMEAVKEGRVYQILRKPCHPTVLTSTLTGAVEQYREVAAQRELLQQATRGTIRALSDLLALMNPAVFGRAERVRRTATKLAGRLALPDPVQLDIAVTLWHLGCLALPPVVADKLGRGRALTEDETALLEELPATATRLVAHIPQLRAVRELLAVLSSPSRKSSIAGQLLHAALETETLESQGVPEKELFETLDVLLAGYDRRMLEELRAMRGEDGAALRVRDVLLRDITEGMVFATDVVTQAGLLLIARGQAVTPPLLERVHTHWAEFARTESMRMIIGDSRVHATEPLVDVAAARAAGQRAAA